MNATYPIRLLILMSLLSPPVIAKVSAQEQEAIELTMIVREEVQIVNESGEKEIKRVPATNVIPGDHVLYIIRYKNTGKEKTDEVVIDNAVPANMTYIDGTAAGQSADVIFSVDGGQTFDKPENLKVVDDDGNEHPAVAKDFTNIRWTLKKSVAPSEEGEVYYRAQLQ